MVWTHSTAYGCHHNPVADQSVGMECVIHHAHAHQVDAHLGVPGSMSLQGSACVGWPPGSQRNADRWMLSACLIAACCRGAVRSGCSEHHDFVCCSFFCPHSRLHTRCLIRQTAEGMAQLPADACISISRVTIGDAACGRCAVCAPWCNTSPVHSSALHSLLCGA
jgi:hypothetical protein